MKYNKIIYTLVLIIALTIGLSSCKKDDKNSVSVDSSELTITMLLDNKEETPLEDIVIVAIYTDGGNGFNVLEGVDKKERTTGKDGKVTFPKLLPGNYGIYIDVNGDDLWDMEKYIQVFPGENDVTFKAAL